MKLKILHISPYYLPDVAFGGPVFSVSALCHALAGQQAEVTVFTVGYEADAGQYPKTETINGVTVRYFKRDWGKPCQVSWQLWKALEEEVSQFDVVHLHTWWNILIFQAIRIIKSKGVPMVVAPRGMMSDYSFTHRKTFLKRWFQSVAGSQLLEAVALHATAPAEAADMALRCHRPVESVHVLPNLLGLKEEPHYTHPGYGYKLGFLSRLHHKKGIEILLDAVAQCPEVDELIIGGGGEPEYEEQLRNQVHQLGIDHRVRFVGWIKQDEKEAFFKQFHVFALPSFNENFANVVAEAWAAGKPSLVSNQVGLCDYVRQHHIGWVCEPSLESTVAAIRQAFLEMDRWKAMGADALELVSRQFTDQHLVEDYLAMYQKLHDASSNGTNPHTVTTPDSTKDLYVLGVNAYHADASAALLKNGCLIAAIEEERFKRIKHWAGFPKESIEFCLQQAGISAGDLDYVAIGRDPRAKWVQKAGFALKHPAAIGFAMRGRLNNAAKADTVEVELEKLQQKIGESGVKSRIQYVEHHRSHLASAFYASGFEEAAILSIDGSGDFSTTMMGLGKGKDIRVLQSIDFPHSLGIFYTAFTQLLGFPHYGDEYKVMGLAPYGEPVYLKALRQVIRLEKDGTFTLDAAWFRPPQKGYVLYDGDHRPQIPLLYSLQMERKFGPVRQPFEEISQQHKDLAASVQKMTEETIFHLLTHLHAKTGMEHVCIAGGVAQNSVANGKIIQHTPFKNIYIPAAGHDAGLSMGAAMYVQHQLLGQPRLHCNNSAYTGARYSNEEILSILETESLPFKKAACKKELFEQVADSISHGGVIGWFRGRSEFGPRALGNRSILADPRRADARELINEKIKRRESFRPFAPSILAEYVDEYFEMADSVPYMEKVYPIKKEKRSAIPAVTHVDGTGRLQTVSRETNPDYYELIDTFRTKTGIPVLLNTSFNENEPIVNTPREALNCFLRTHMDMLVLEDFIITRKGDKA